MIDVFPGNVLVVKVTGLSEVGDMQSSGSDDDDMGDNDDDTGDEDKSDLD